MSAVVFAAAFAALFLVTIFFVTIWRKPRQVPVPVLSEQPGPQPVVAPQRPPAAVKRVRRIRPGDAVYVPEKSKRPDGSKKTAIFVRYLHRRGREMAQLLSASGQGFLRPKDEMRRV